MTRAVPRLRRAWRVIRRVWITLGITATIVFVTWSLVAYRATDEARRALASDATVVVTDTTGATRFVPAPGRARAGAGLLFVAGALVDPVAYAPLARAAAAAGHEAWIVALPRRGAFGGAEDPALLARVAAIMGRADAPRRWVVGGHSRGAVIAVQVAHARPARLAGLVLVGSSHPRDVSLADLAVPVTKIVGTRDGLASPAEVRANAHLLPASTRWVWIDGGNHSQFGWYGFQPGDRRARVPAGVQRATMVRAVREALRQAAG